MWFDVVSVSDIRKKKKDRKKMREVLMRGCHGGAARAFEKLVRSFTITTSADTHVLTRSKYVHARENWATRHLRGFTILELNNRASASISLSIFEVRCCLVGAER